MQPRPAHPTEIEQLARVWYDAWQDAHAQILPAELTRVRTFDTFRQRLGPMLPNTSVVGDLGSPIGLCAIKQDELDQLFVSATGRGTGVATALIADAEARLAAAGVGTAWLSCAIGNDRAARFYEKSGWHLARNYVSRLDTPAGVFELEVWRYEKNLQPLTG